MCIIVDANSAHQLKNKTADGKPVLDWLLRPRISAGLLVGGKLTDELERAGLRETLVELKRAGRLFSVRQQEIDAADVAILKAGGCQSNDRHLVALARATRCNIVFTADAALHLDLKNKSLVPTHTRIYQSEKHKKLLTNCRCPV